MIDCEEAQRWLKQADYTLRAVKADIEGGFHAWACFKSHQAAEYALKAVLRSVGVESFGHDLVELWRKTSRICDGMDRLRLCIALLNKLYVPPRYPDAWAGGAVPFENYTEKDSQEAMECAREVLDAVKECLVKWCETPEEEGGGLA